LIILFRIINLGFFLRGLGNIILATALNGPAPYHYFLDFHLCLWYQSQYTSQPTLLSTTYLSEYSYLDNQSCKFHRLILVGKHSKYRPCLGSRFLSIFLKAYFLQNFAIKFESFGIVCRLDTVGYIRNFLVILFVRIMTRRLLGAAKMSSL